MKNRIKLIIVAGMMLVIPFALVGRTGMKEEVSTFLTKMNNIPLKSGDITFIQSLQMFVIEIEKIEKAYFAEVGRFEDDIIGYLVYEVKRLSEAKKGCLSEEDANALDRVYHLIDGSRGSIEKANEKNKKVIACLDQMNEWINFIYEVRPYIKGYLDPLINCINKDRIYYKGMYEDRMMLLRTRDLSN